MCEKLKNLKKTEFKIAKLLQKNILSAKELQNILQVDKATVYRNLNSLLKKKIIREIKNSDGVGFYEINCKIHNPIHPHFECRICKKIYCLNALKPEDVISLSNYTDFEIESIKIKFEGVCNECKKRMEKK
jgi:Fur family ferric uptake transcriptional regulator